MTTKNCNDCACHLHICKAECCRGFSIIMPEGTQEIKKGWFEVKCELDEEMKHYYRLHRCIITPTGFIVRLDKYKIEGNKINIYHDCIALTQDYKCKLHGLSTQPKVCKTPNNKGDPLAPLGTVTPNCIYKKLYD